MDNPNNSWTYPPPPPYGYPPPPPPKGFSVPPAGKSRGLALAMVCLMALAALVSAAMPFFIGAGTIDGVLSNPLYVGMNAANLLLSLLAYLKFVLPGWEPHRKTLGWLLTAELASTLAFSIYAVFQGLQAGVSFAGEAYGGMDSAAMAVVRVAVVIGLVIGIAAAAAVNPFFYLIIGAWKKKSMEKLAGVFAAISGGLTLLVIPLFLLLGRLTDGAIEVSSLLPSYIIAFVSAVGATVFYFTWPVLDRPVLEKAE